MARLSPQRRAAVTKLEQSPGLLARLIDEINDLLAEQRAVYTAMGRQYVPAWAIRQARPYAPDILLAEELE